MHKRSLLSEQPSYYFANLAYLKQHLTPSFKKKNSVVEFSFVQSALYAPE